MSDRSDWVMCWQKPNLIFTLANSDLNEMRIAAASLLTRQCCPHCDQHITRGGSKAFCSSSVQKHFHSTVPSFSITGSSQPRVRRTTWTNWENNRLMSDLWPVLRPLQVRGRYTVDKRHTKSGNLTLKDEAWLGHHSVHDYTAKTTRQLSAGTPGTDACPLWAHRIC